MPRIVTTGPLDSLRLLHATPSSIDPAALPSDLVVLKWGDNETPNGNVKVGLVTLASLPANQKALNFDRICLDYNHNTVPEGPCYKGEPNEVAAYGVPTVERGVGIKLCNIQWSESASKYVGGGHYRDLSPAVKLDPVSGEVIFIHSAAVCRQGAVTGLILNSAHSGAKTPNHKSMDPKKLLLAILGLGESATDEEITAAAEKFGKEEAKEPVAAGGGEDLKTLCSLVKTQGESLLALSARIDGDARAGIIAAATAEGKVVPVEVHGLPADQLRTLCAKLPVTVPVTRETPELVILSADKKVTDPVQKQVNAAMGISDEQFAKYNG